MAHSFRIYPEQEIKFIDHEFRRYQETADDAVISPRQQYKTAIKATSHEHNIKLRSLSNIGIEELVAKLFRDHTLVKKAAARKTAVVLDSGLITPENRELHGLSHAKASTIDSPYQTKKILVSVLYFPQENNTEYDPTRAKIEIVGHFTDSSLMDKNPIKVHLLDENLARQVEQYIRDGVYMGTSAAASRFMYSGEIFTWSAEIFKPDSAISLKNGYYLPCKPVISK
jgi:hypothetical protein